MPSRWTESADEIAAAARKKEEKEEKRRLKAERLAAQQEAEQAQAEERPSKRRRLSSENIVDTPPQSQPPAFNVPAPTWQRSRTVQNFELLNSIEEGSYGFVSRARTKTSGEIVALKKLKLDPLRDAGFPVTALREIQCLNIAKHRHIVDLKEVVVGDGDEKGDVYLVMEFLEHDLKSLQEDMLEPFTPSEVKTLMLQLGSAVEFLHEHWILHRDLKTSNILMNNQGEIKIADFGMARLCGNPAPANLTQLVVTLWYRAPELLLGATTYDTAVDMWSIGCIFGELLSKSPLLRGKNEVDQITKIFDICGMPNKESWPDYKRLPNARHLRLSDRSKKNRVRAIFPNLSDAGALLLDNLLSLNPEGRISAKDMLEHTYFAEQPRPKPTAMFPTFPSKAGQEKRRKYLSPHAPIRGVAPTFDKLNV